MDLTLTEDQQMIRDNARGALKAECTRDHVRAMAASELGYDRALWTRIAELGWHGVALPDEYGGLGLGLIELCLILEEQGRFLYPGPFVPTVVLAARAVARFGTPAQRERLLPAIAEGRRVLAVAHTGPDWRWSPGAVGVKGRRVASELVLDGAAELVAWARAADELLVMARVGGDLMGVLVPADAEGLDIEATPTIAEERHCRVVLSGVRVPAGAALEGRGEGPGEDLAGRLLAWGAVASCAEMLGAGDRVLEMTVAWARERKAFGKPIGSFQAIQHHCANMAVDVLAARGVTLEAAWRLDRDSDSGEAVAVAKAWVSDAMARVCALGHQVHGAIGFTEEHDLHLYTRRVRSLELAFGDAAWHRSRLAARHGLAA